jgi:hypothetical protein
MYTEVLKVMHALATCILLILVTQLKEILLRILTEMR